jgi:hypothetical protein
MATQQSKDKSQYKHVQRDKQNKQIHKDKRSQHE